MVDRDEKNREARLRRQLGQHGFKLHKTPARSWLRSYYDVGFMVTDDRNYVRCGYFSGRQYTATLDEVQDFLAEYLRDRATKEAA